MKKQLLKTLIVAAFTAVSVLVPSAPAFAETEKPAVWLQISPVANRVTLNPNDNLTYKMEVSNIGVLKFPVGSPSIRIKTLKLMPKKNGRPKLLLSLNQISAKR